jgi:ubiquitin-protein ligase
LQSDLHSSSFITIEARASKLSIDINRASSPHEGGIFHLSIQYPANYPLNPPWITFTTEVYHADRDADGNIDPEMLKDPPNMDADGVMACLKNGGARFVGSELVF